MPHKIINYEKFYEKKNTADLIVEIADLKKQLDNTIKKICAIRFILFTRGAKQND